MFSLTFLNHSSFFLEDTDSILLLDPWFEGKAFNDGWSLIDQTYNNNFVIDLLKSKKKKIYIWYSHEHSDHFSTNFVRSAKDRLLEFEVIYKETKDKRLYNFFTKQNFKVNIVNKKNPTFEITKKFKISSYAFSHSEKHSDDSFALINLNGLSILNLNDCEINTNADMNFIREKIKQQNNVDIIFSQFSYAGYCGENNSSSDRELVANKILERIDSINNFFNPLIYIPFASFIYFSHHRNFYMNDCQNTPLKLLKKFERSNMTNKFSFPIPMKSYEVKHSVISDILAERIEAFNYWHEKYKIIDQLQPINKTTEKNKISITDIQQSYLKFKNKIHKNFLLYFLILKIFFFLNSKKYFKYLIPNFFIKKFAKEKPIVVKIDDLNLLYEFSFFKSKKVENIDPDATINSDDLKYCFDNEFGFNTLEVNCKSNLKNPKKLFNFFRFIYYMKDGLNFGNLFIERIKQYKFGITKKKL